MPKSYKVIHIVESLDKGAVENWLVRMFKYGQKKGEKLDWTFYCIESFKGRLEDKVQKLGGKIIHSKNNWGEPRKLVAELRKVLIKGKYDVMHAHHDFMSALYLLSAFSLPIQRIVHVHNMDEHIPSLSKKKIAISKYIFRRICWSLSSNIVGISKHTLDRFLLNRKLNPRKHKILYYGVDHKPFLDSLENKEIFQTTFNIPTNKKVILFCARIDPAKNPLYAVDLFKELDDLDEKDDYVLLMVGKGGLQNEVEKRIEKLNLSHKVRQIGWSDNIPFILKNSDLLLYPHQEYPLEGLGLILVESQLSQLPVLASIGVGRDPFFHPQSVQRLKLSAPPSIWIENIKSMTSNPKPEKKSVVKEFKASPFLMETAFENMMNIYKN